MNTLERVCVASFAVMTMWAVLAYFCQEVHMAFMILMLSQIYIVCTMVMSVSHAEEEIQSIQDFQSFEHKRILDISNTLNVQTGKLMLTNQALSRIDDHLRYASKNIQRTTDSVLYMRELIDRELDEQNEQTVQEVYGPIHRPDLQKEAEQ